jgi:hypothetical protein
MKPHLTLVAVTVLCQREGTQELTPGIGGERFHRVVGGDTAPTAGLPRGGISAWRRWQA